MPANTHPPHFHFSDPPTPPSSGHLSRASSDTFVTGDLELGDLRPALGDLRQLDALSDCSLGDRDDDDAESGSWSDDTLASAAGWPPKGRPGDYWNGRWPETREQWGQLLLHLAAAALPLLLQAALYAFHTLRHNPRAVFITMVATASSLAVFVAFPIPTTVHLFAGVCVGVATFTAIKWLQVLRTTAAALARSRPTCAGSAACLPLARWSSFQLGSLACGTALVLFALCVGVTTPVETVPFVPRGADHRYFIGANLYNNENILDHWTGELVKVIDHLGPSNVFVSIYESNSDDATPEMLGRFGLELETMGVRHRIVSEKGSLRWWPYITSPERIDFLAQVRNRVLEPLQSSDDAVRLPDYDSFEKVVFLNDILYTWQSVIRLLATATPDEMGIRADGDYDLACGIDFQILGMYDTWVARDVCGTPMRIMWPYVKDEVSKEQVRKNEPFPVSACWNGIVAFPPKPILYNPAGHPATTAEGAGDDTPRSLHKRGWKMIDNATYPNSLMSPPITTPIKFRQSNLQACDHSECFLFSYDMQRLYSSPERPARILMNPDVVVAYRWRWYYWYVRILRIPLVQLYQQYVSHGWLMTFVDDRWERMFSRNRDYCTWSQLATNAPARCPPLPGTSNRGWHQ